MRKLAIILACVACTVFLAAWSHGALTGGVPYNITPVSCTTSTPITNGGILVTGCTLSASNSPTGWSIVSQSCASCYSITSGGVVEGGSNAGNVGTETDTITVTASNGAGTSTQTTITINAYADGFVNAPNGTAQFPHLLDASSSTNTLGHNLATRAPWEVAGVDYPVGIDRTAYPTNANLKDPYPGGAVASGLIALGASSTLLNGNAIQITGSNITIDGWDFSLHGGLGLYIAGGNNIMISNDNIVGGSNGSIQLQITSSATNVTVKNNVIDGGSTGPISSPWSGTTGALESNCPSLTVEYNLIQNGWAETTRFGSETSSGFNTVVKYNAIGNAGLGSQNFGLHGDWSQILTTANTIVNSLDWEFNFFFQTTTYAQGRTQGISYNGTTSSGTAAFVDETENYNSFVMNTSSPELVNNIVNYDYSWLSGMQTANYNYVDVTGPGTGGWWAPANGTGPYGGDTRFTKTGNVNLLTGASLP